MGGCQWWWAANGPIVLWTVEAQGSSTQLWSVCATWLLTTRRILPVCSSFLDKDKDKDKDIHKDRNTNTDH